MKLNFLTVCEIFFKLKFSKFIQDIRTLKNFGKFLLKVMVMPFLHPSLTFAPPTPPIKMNEAIKYAD